MLEQCVEHAGAVMCAPIQGTDVPFGALLACRAGADPFELGDLLFLRLVANVLAVAFEVDAARSGKHESEALLAAVLESIPDLVIRFDRELRHLYVSPSVERATAQPVGDYIGRTNLELGVPKALCDFWERELRPVFELRVERSFDFDFPGPDGMRSYETKAVPEFGAGGTVESVIVVTRDITDRLRDVRERIAGVAALERSERLFRGAFEDAAVGMLLVDADARIVRVNDAFARLLGATPEALVGRSPDELTHPDDIPASKERRASLLLGEADRTTLEKRYLRTDGEPVDVIAGVSALRGGDGRVELFVVQVQDMTERNRLEVQLRQAQKLEAVGMLAGGIAHDFNNLLTGINGYSDILLDEIGRLDNERAIHAVTEVRKAGDRASDLIRQLLAFSRQQVLHAKTFSLNDVVGDFSSLLRRTLGEDVTIELRLAPELTTVTADPGQIGQVIMNLAVNARDAMPDGGTLWVRTHVRECLSPLIGGVTVEPGTYVVLEVEDNGSGMDAATEERIFEPFYTTKDVNKGTGLGLPTVLGIVQQSGGALTVDSEPGVGTAFRVYLPQVEAPSDVAGEPSATRSPTIHDEHVLLVEDDDMVREIVEEMLSTSGFRVTALASPGAALELGDEIDEVDLLLTDVVMPRMNGHDLAMRLSERRPSLRILYTSGYPSDVVRERGVLDNADVFVQKPFSAGELIAKIEGLLAPT
jgi:two-component system cell cycle sensor histidine kinase/response regulator CckA